ncbi:mitochondrial carrier protein [Coccidioides immitis RS]|uniref:Mitochondrial aspartate-glutamate transporter AGC1 n=7 Tax=Coccidioides TaxID=5500 RepID=J3KE19_COCIM|nr:mitochondrial carrier protein [Coccidioides immitis RS]XP_003071580.1 Mitochondrial carrier family protein [Coccidioides posadasii C735 delta SOWgp]EFW15363.1 mitochondrial carrier protein [Coccidioides posadasii str. Silveira]KMM70205.1 calcium-binding mitochondrial carrier protein Aralar2 [Coccidioides posadasii RMSCC 3488]KMP04870.1 calcium-binding carrier protein Aralar2 [Coccidioides immitis RMSCC 2394]KMU78432.1 calcium-binding mitochondrial carrier protein Aralar2 [Coccidioides immit|eukprot:XP_003071580.1 Mitochondrial carrier family protein [Coccidioides posadasii C735 delta SOWgp]
MAQVKDALKASLVGTPEQETPMTAQVRANFMQHARTDTGTGELYMMEEDFINAIAPKQENYHKIKREQYGILFQVADRRQTGRVNLGDWAAFESLLAKPDAEYEIAFRLFDADRTGTVKCETIQKLYNANKSGDAIPFDWNSEWASLYTGRKKTRHDMTYPQFAQMLRGLQGERIRQAFHLFDKDGDGYIEPEDFQRIILQTAKHKLSDHLLENLPTLCNISTGSKISYANVRAFQNIIREMDMIEYIIRSAISKSKDGMITKADFLNEAARVTRFSLFTPMEADILFHFAGMDTPSGKLSWSDFTKVIDSSWHTTTALGAEAIATVSHATDQAVTKSKKLLQGLLESVHHFALGSLAGAFGAFMVYPIDLVKTRMQNQRSARVGEKLYNNSVDCARKVIRNEGVLGLYSGVLPQLIGVAPEKAIKLTVNDLVRGTFTEKKTGNIWWPYELLAGGTAGACQVVFTNPLEIVKIRLQVQGEIAKSGQAAPRRSAMWIIKNLGLVGLYKGASACLLRDVPFSAIYFPTYAHLKSDFFGETPTKKLGILQLLTAGAIAGMPAAYLTTPCDVIKTRLQVEARKGETKYTSLRHCATTILKEEGFTAFFKGGPARILRSSPQFGFTLAAYEVLQKLLPLPGAPHEDVTPTGSVEPGIGLQPATAPLPYLRSRNALKLILDLDENFGRIRVPQSKSWPGFPGVSRQ